MNVTMRLLLILYNTTWHITAHCRLNLFKIICFVLIETDSTSSINIFLFILIKQNNLLTCSLIKSNKTLNLIALFLLSVLFILFDSLSSRIAMHRSDQTKYFFSFLLYCVIYFIQKKMMSKIVFIMMKIFCLLILTMSCLLILIFLSLQTSFTIFLLSTLMMLSILNQLMKHKV